jgi:hypothetical protein
MIQCVENYQYCENVNLLVHIGLFHSKEANFDLVRGMCLFKTHFSESPCI